MAFAINMVCDQVKILWLTISKSTDKPCLQWCYIVCPSAQVEDAVNLYD